MRTNRGRRLGWVLAFTVAASLMINGGCNRASVPRLRGSGSTLAYPIMSKWSAVYEARFQVPVDYQSIGSGAGIAQLLEGQTDFACTDLPLTAEQERRADDAGGVVQIPVLLTAVVPVYRLEGMDKPLHFSGPVLADIFLGRIRKWNDPALRALNRGIDLPDRQIVALHRGDASGTTALFTGYLARVSDDWRRTVGSGTVVQWPVGIGSKG